MPTHSESPASNAGANLSPFRDGAADDRAAWAKLCNLQRRILPSVAPPVPGYRQVIAYRPAFVVTGDYHDFFHRPDGRLAVFVGDGSGQGPAASMLMAMMRTIMHTHPDLHQEPGQALTRAGRMFQQLLPSDLFMTGIYLVLGGDGAVSWASAGHHPPLWATGGGQVSPVDLEQIGQVLGLVSQQEYVTVTWQLRPSDRLLLFTDGLWEAANRSGDQFGRKRLADYWAGATRRPLDRAVADLISLAEAHLEGSDFDDDFTVVGIEWQA